MSHPSHTTACIGFKLHTYATVSQASREDQAETVRPPPGSMGGQETCGSRLAVILTDTEGRRHLNQSRLEQVIIWGRIICERSFCPLIKRRWRLKIRNGYWSMVALSVPTLMTRQCNLMCSGGVQRCWWVFRELYFSVVQFISSQFCYPAFIGIPSHTCSYLWSEFKIKPVNWNLLLK